MHYESLKDLESYYLEIRNNNDPFAIARTTNAPIENINFLENFRE